MEHYIFRVYYPYSATGANGYQVNITDSNSTRQIPPEVEAEIRRLVSEMRSFSFLRPSPDLLDELMTATHEPEAEEHKQPEPEAEEEIPVAWSEAELKRLTFLRDHVRNRLIDSEQNVED